MRVIQIPGVIAIAGMLATGTGLAQQQPSAMNPEPRGANARHNGTASQEHHAASQQHAMTHDQQAAMQAQPGCAIPCPPSAAQRRVNEERARARRAEREAQAAAIEAATADAARLSNELGTERSERTSADASMSQQLSADHAQIDSVASNLASLQTEHDRLAALTNRYTLQQHTVARGGGPMVDNGGFYRRPRLEFTFEGGGAGYGSGLTNVVNTAGGAWGTRLGLAFSSWLALEARYFGAYNALTADNTSGVLVSGGSVVGRLTLPIPYVHLYGFGGVGIYNQRVTASSSTVTDNQLSSINGRNSTVLPVGGGLEIPITRNFAIAAEGTYHVFLGTSGTNSSNNMWTGSGLLRFTL